MKAIYAAFFNISDQIYSVNFFNQDLYEILKEIKSFGSYAAVAVVTLEDAGIDVMHENKIPFVLLRRNKLTLSA